MENVVRGVPDGLFENLIVPLGVSQLCGFLLSDFVDLLKLKLYQLIVKLPILVLKYNIH